MARLTLEDYVDAAQRRGLRVEINETPSNNRTRVWWVCENGHRRYSTIQAVCLTQACVRCYGPRRRLSFIDFDQIASPKGIQWVGVALPGVLELTPWRCVVGHTWTACYNNIQQGHSCPFCAVQAKLTKEDYVSAGEAVGLKWAETEMPATCTTNTWWTCDKGHRYEASVTAVKQMSKRRHKNQKGCPMCIHCGPSKPQIEIFDYVQSLVPNEEVRLSDRTAIKPLELDVYVPSRKFALEYHGLWWHCDRSDQGEKYDPKANQRKALLCQKEGIKLLMIFADEWENKPELIKAMIRWRLGVFTGTKLHARKLEMKRLDKNKEFKDFFIRNHINGHAMASFAYGLFHEGKLVMCCSCRTNHQGETELARMASDYDYSVSGGAGRLIKAIVTERPGDLVSYADNRLSSGGVYKALGFDLLASNGPSYYYSEGSLRVWRYRCRRVNTPEVITQYPTEKTQALGGVFSRMYLGNDKPMRQIHDAGHAKFILRGKPSGV